LMLDEDDASSNIKPQTSNSVDYFFQ
jgi:hypothetical protein